MLGSEWISCPRILQDYSGLVVFLLFFYIKKHIVRHSGSVYVCVRVRPRACVRKSIKSPEKLSFAFRTSDDDVERKNVQPRQQREVHILLFRSLRNESRKEGRSRRGQGKTSAARSRRTPNSVGKINMPNESKADYIQQT